MPVIYVLGPALHQPVTDRMPRSASSASGAGRNGMPTTKA
jgi:hypothetical protein